MGETTFPKNIPNLNHNVFNGNRIDEFNKPKVKKIKLSTNDQYLGSPPFIKG